MFIPADRASSTLEIAGLEHPTIAVTAHCYAPEGSAHG